MVRVGSPPRTVRDVFFDDAFLARADLTGTTANPAQTEALARLKKASVLLKSVSLTPGQTSWLFGGAFSVLDVNTLPLSATDPRASFADWRAWRELLDTAQSLKDGLTVVEQLGEAIATGAAQPNALFRDACEVADVQDVVDAVSVLNITWPDDFRQPSRLLKLVTLLNLMRMLGCQASLLKQFTAFSPSETNALSARKLFMAQFDSDTLPARMEPVSNKLRARASAVRSSTISGLDIGCEAPTSCLITT